MRSRLPLSNLNTFAAAAETGSFQQAAGQLHVTPSAVSHQIRNLEQLLGYRLFERLDKKVRLTPRGERLFADIQQPLQQLHRAAERAQRCQRDDHLALSVAPAFATRWLLPRLDRFYAAHPEINLSVTATTELVDFRFDPVDVAIRLGSGDWPGTESQLLFSLELVAVCRPELLAANGGPFGIDELTQQPLVHNASIDGLWQRWLRSAGLTIKGELPGFRVQNAAQSLEAVYSGDRICLIDRPFVVNELADGRLALANAHSYSGDQGYYLTCPAGIPENPALITFSQWLFGELND